MLGALVIVGILINQYVSEYSLYVCVRAVIYHFSSSAIQVAVSVCVFAKRFEPLPSKATWWAEIRASPPERMCAGKREPDGSACEPTIFIPIAMHNPIHVLCPSPHTPGLHQNACGSFSQHTLSNTIEAAGVYIHVYMYNRLYMYIVQQWQ